MILAPTSATNSRRLILCPRCRHLLKVGFCWRRPSGSDHRAAKATYPAQRAAVLVSLLVKSSHGGDQELAAILAADVVEYSKLAATDGGRPLRPVTPRFGTVQGRPAAPHTGRNGPPKVKLDLELLGTRRCVSPRRPGAFAHRASVRSEHRGRGAARRRSPRLRSRRSPRSSRGAWKISQKCWHKEMPALRVTLAFFLIGGAFLAEAAQAAS